MHHGFFSRFTSIYKGALVAGLAWQTLLGAGDRASAADLINYEQLHASTGGPADAEYLYDSVIEGNDGRIYGAAVNGGHEDGGTLYMIRKDGSGFTILREFLYDDLDGTSPNAPLLRAKDGALYGTTFYGGGDPYATVFRIKPCALLVERGPSGGIIHFEGFASHRYALDATDSLPPTWNEIATVTNLTGKVQWLDTTGASHRFYRARVLAP